MFRIFQIFLYLFLGLSLSVQGQDSSILIAGQHHKSTIAAKEKHSFRLDLGAKQFVYGEVDQKGVSIVINVFNPEGKRIGKFNMYAGQKRFYIESSDAGQYKLEISPIMFGTPEKTGEYDLEIKPIEALGDTPAKHLDQLLNALYKDDGPGGAVIITREGKTIYSKAYGMANMEYSIPFTTETASNIGSVSKQFTAFAIALLEKEGKLSFDDDIRKYLPDCPDFGQVVTLQNLLDHTSGYREIKKTFGMRSVRGFWTRQELIQHIQRQSEPMNPPGSVCSYVNTGYLLLAEVVEQISGISFSDWIKQNIFDPLGMEHSMVNSPLFAQIYRVIPNSAKGYYMYGGKYGYLIDESAFYGASSIYSSVNDLSKWLKNFGDARIGGQELMSRITKPGLLTGGDTLDYAFGLKIDKQNGLQRYSHSGFDGFHWTQMNYYPSIDVGIIILNNFRIFPSVKNKISEIFLSNDFKVAVINTQEEPKKDPDFKVDPELLKIYSGRYAVVEDKRMMVTFEQEDDQLQADIKSSLLLPSSFSMKAISDSTFVKADLDISVTFQLDENNKLKTARLHYDRDFTLHPLPLYKPSSEELLAFTGLYYSAELEAAYTINLVDNTLVVSHPSAFTTKLSPSYPDTFSGGYLGEYLFKRTEGGKISGFMAQSIYFEKVK